MPRTKLSARLPNPDAVAKLIKRYTKIERGIAAGDVAEQAGFSQSLYYKRLKEPEKFTLAELRGFAKALKIPPEELTAALAEAIRY